MPFFIMILDVSINQNQGNRPKNNQRGCCIISEKPVYYILVKKMKNTVYQTKSVNENHSDHKIEKCNQPSGAKYIK